MPRRAVVLLVAVAALLGACGDGGGAPSPEHALQGFSEAVATGKCRDAASYVISEFMSESALCSDLPTAQQTAAAIGGASAPQHIDDSRAVVVAKPSPGGSGGRVIALERRGAGWKIAGTSACLPVEHPKDIGSAHVWDARNVRYSSDPPTSGPHTGRSTPIGRAYAKAQPKADLVHAMEHGAVVLWLSDADGKAAGQVSRAFRALRRAGYRSLIVVPADYDVPLVMTAWGSLQRCVDVDTDAIRTFVAENYASGPEWYIACIRSWVKACRTH